MRVILYTFGLQVTGKSPLHLACERGDFDLTQLLVERGADVTVVDGRGLSVLHHPSTLKAPDVVTYLLHNGLEVDIKHQVNRKQEYKEEKLQQRY